MHKKNKYQCLAGLLAACLMMSVLPSGTKLIYADGADMDATVQTTAMRAVYDELYHQYLRLHDLFGRGGLDTMKALKSIQRKAYSQR